MTLSTTTIPTKSWRRRWSPTSSSSSSSSSPTSTLDSFLSTKAFVASSSQPPSSSSVSLRRDSPWPTSSSSSLSSFLLLLLSPINGTSTVGPLIKCRSKTLATTTAAAASSRRSLSLTILLILSSMILNLLVPTNINQMHGVHCWNWAQPHISEELLDRFICLRAKGFFPHEHRCDHFYECRNGTIVNEGICRPGLRFDYRYRKKPRCIPIDQIDCRITQIDYNEYLDTPEPTFMPNNNNHQHQTSPITTTTLLSTTTTTTTTQSPPLLTIHRHYHHQSSANQNQNRIPMVYGGSGNPSPTSSLSTPSHRTTTSISSSPVSFRHYTTLTTSSQFTPSPPTTTGSTIATTENPLLIGTTTTTESPTTLMAPNPDDDLDEMDQENFLGKKRKLLKKPLKLRRGRLQQPQDDMDDQPAPQSTSTSQAASGAASGTSSTHLTEQILSRAISTLNYDNRQTRSMHCPHPNGYYPDRDDCRKFYACDDGRAFLMSCPLGLAYDEMTGTCSWPDMVEGCRSEEMLRFNCPEPNENEILDYGDPRYPTSDCRKFVVCIQSEIHGARTPRLLGCEEGLVFNPDSRECDYPENVPTCSNYYETHHLSRSISRSISSRKRKNHHHHHRI